MDAELSGATSPLKWTSLSECTSSADLPGVQLALSELHRCIRCFDNSQLFLYTTASKRALPLPSNSLSFSITGLTLGLADRTLEAGAGGLAEANLPVGVRVEELKGQERAYHVELRGKFLPLLIQTCASAVHRSQGPPRYAVTVLGVEADSLGGGGGVGRRRWYTSRLRCTWLCSGNKIPFIWNGFSCSPRSWCSLGRPQSTGRRGARDGGASPIEALGGGVRSEERGVRSHFQTHPGVQTLTLYVVGLRSITSSEARLSQSK